MIWRNSFIERMADWMRFCSRSAAYVIAILASLFALAFTAKFLWYLWSYVNRTLFGAPW